MSVTDLDLQNLIITTLSDADPTALAGLQSNVPRYWLLWARQGYLPELRYWYVRREALRYLMACLTQQIDYVRRSGSASRVMTASSRRDSEMAASGSETASSLANRSATSNFSSATTSSGSGSSSMNRNAHQSQSGSGSMSDTGSGTNQSSQTSTLESSSSVEATASDSSAAQSQETHEVCGAYEHRNASGKVSAGVNLGVGGAITYSGTYELIPPENNTISTVRTSNSVSQSVQKERDVRSNSSVQHSDRSSSSYFNANRTASESMSASGGASMASSSSSSFSLTGSGSGSMTGSGAGSSNMTGSSVRDLTGTGEAHRLSNAQSATTNTMARLHQRFLHLQEMWKRANEMIRWFEKQRLNLPAYVFQTLTLQYPDGLNADIANQYLVKDPYGLTVVRP